MSDSPRQSGPTYAGVPVAPDVTERIGATLVRQLQAVPVDVVLSWSEPSDAVLAHVVARELGVRTVRVRMVEGLLDTSGRIDDGDRVVLVGEEFHEPNSISAPSGLAGVHQANVVAVAAAVPSAELGTAGVLVVTPDGVDG